MTIENYIIEILKRYQSEKMGRFGRSDFSDMITKELPEIINEQLIGRREYIVKGSMGNGGWAEIPWLAIMDPYITTSTQRGYYVVLLFDTIAQELILSLEYGWTSFKDKYGAREGLRVIRGLTSKTREELPILPRSFIKGEPSFSDIKGNLAKGYCYGTVGYRTFSINELQTESQLLTSIELLLEIYQQLITQYGAGEGFINEAEVLSKESVINEKSTNGKLIDVIDYIDQQHPVFKERLTKYAVRCRSFADLVKKRANYTCEVCGREPFILKGGGLYAEADHIKPLYDSGLDHPDNMRCLCAQCHAVITYGADEEVEELLSTK